MIAAYSKEAARLSEYRKKLLAEAAALTDTDALSALERRIELVETERYEILADIESMISYESERSQCRERA